MWIIKARIIIIERVLNLLKICCNKSFELAWNCHNLDTTKSACVNGFPSKWEVTLSTNRLPPTKFILIIGKQVKISLTIIISPRNKIMIIYWHGWECGSQGKTFKQFFLQLNSYHSKGDIFSSCKETLDRFLNLPLIARSWIFSTKKCSHGLWCLAFPDSRQKILSLWQHLDCFTCRYNAHGKKNRIHWYLVNYSYHYWYVMVLYLRGSEYDLMAVMLVSLTISLRIKLS